MPCISVTILQKVRAVKGEGDSARGKVEEHAALLPAQLRRLKTLCGIYARTHGECQGILDPRSRRKNDFTEQSVRSLVRQTTVSIFFKIFFRRFSCGTAIFLLYFATGDISSRLYLVFLHFLLHFFPHKESVCFKSIKYQIRRIVSL